MIDPSEYKQSKPLIRSLLAFIIFLRYGDIKACYLHAEWFLDQFEEDSGIK